MEDSKFLIICAALVLFLAAFFVFRPRKEDVANTKKREMGKFTAAQVAKHNSRDDLWLILDRDGTSKVYDLTSYVDEHPGGDAILQNAGGDSTEAFFGPQHPPRVMDLIDDFCIGELVTE